jgi:hypothetical protein
MHPICILLQVLFTHPLPPKNCLQDILGDFIHVRIMTTLAAHLIFVTYAYHVKDNFSKNE